jgi:acyl-CoA synthetase (AMP-forming)/AMP-acid ligase II
VGEIWVRGPKVVSGYLDDPEATAGAFLPGGWYRTGDTGYLDDEGFLFVTGRLNELINRGGDKIAPAEVDGALLAHPAVRDAAAFAVPDKRLGEDVVAAVVLNDGQTATPRELRRWLLNRLSPHKAPRRIWFVPELPRTATGKVQRGVLSERFLAAQANG